MKTLIISSSLDLHSRSEILSEKCRIYLSLLNVNAELISLKKFKLPGFDNGNISSLPAYQALHALVSEAEGIILASPVYNWGCCAELKKFIEYIGSTPTDGSARGALFDKLITFVNAAGLPHSYMAFTGMASSLMLDFKCIINPYNLYVHNRHWDGDTLIKEAQDRLEKTMNVHLQLSTLLTKRTYQSGWEI